MSELNNDPHKDGDIDGLGAFRGVAVVIAIYAIIGICYAGYKLWNG